MGWSEEQTLYSDVNAIIIGFHGKLKLVAYENGINPWSPPSDPTQVGNAPKRVAPDPAKLPPLTPEAFDAMFPGKRK